MRKLLINPGYELTFDYSFLTYYSVTMQAQKEAPIDMQCKDKFLLQSVVAAPGATAKDITAEMVTNMRLS